MMRTLKFVFRTGIFTYRALFTWINPPDFVVVKLGVPFFLVLTFVLISDYGAALTGQDAQSYINFVVVGNALYVSTFNTLMGPMFFVFNERREGTLELLFSTPVNRPLLNIAKSAIHIGDGIFGIFIVLLYGVTLFGLRMSVLGSLYMIVIAFLSVISMMGFGLLFSGLALYYRQPHPIVSMMLSATMFFCGVTFPVGMLPQSLQYISKAIPLTHGIEAARLAVIEEFSPIPMLLARELIVGALLFCLGSFVLGYFEHLAKKSGKLVFF
ncbi:MAG: ABC transporter permease [Theionarchaea archaeon]|nr:ABC transporter permease [Theionarchaea archaeon]MBU7038821.1 ABC transporter permease [Theionarchaea archaeon]